ncbi:beta-ketoacyl synthase domain-containing protein [Truncatella angustata]|uniref:Beta-ketoacyl synthase domain-containing protein n=1 Tax=Truncatella angustata TaxID=152316 RepID=A0A9P8UBA0_9PEZI|nr:beta-ketoacyl synthase domain-containing protein [Truncatella angustata]KAH6640085.1 beta-ketoacyl synthase domain-containing protein [Truncatella angustata]
MYKEPSSEPIAIVGSSCRFAGEAVSPSALWQVLANPPDLSKQVPPNRFNAHAFYHEDGENHGTTNSIKAYWLEQDHRVFDASFFNITPKEAEAIDPQQRLLLEVVYEAMESAGYTLHQYSGKDVGVFAGVMTADYDTLSQRDELSASQYYATGNARSIISNRVSYFFNFRGPSMTIDTACSSSLVALHQAVLSLRSGEITLACVAGVNLMITPEQFIVESSLHMLSPSGKSRMWDQSADGYARGEGVAALFLKPLSLALHDGDEILGLVRQTGVNSDGRTPGITMPNPDAQASLIKSTYRTSGLDPQLPEDRCQYFEAHGTGTQAGDPREAQAIQEAFFGEHSTNKHHTKLLVGSVKTVIGHTEGAAGLAGVLKVLQGMKHNKVPPNLHLETLNSSVRPFYAELEIPTVLTPWPKPLEDQPKRASVNSFGFGGTNSHAIIEAYDARIHDTVARRFTAFTRRRTLHDLDLDHELSLGMSPTTLPLLISASSHKSLRAVVSTWKDYLVHNRDTSIQQLAWNLFRYRTALPYRLSISSSSVDQAIEQLEFMISQGSDNAELGTRSHAAKRPHILGIFTGQGAQWPAMSRLLLLSNGRYRQTIQELDQVLQQCPDPPSWSLEQQIMAESSQSRLQEAAVAQPLSTALQIGLVDLLKSLGIRFQAVIGHSSGEIAAAYAAERLSARDAMLISYYRGLYAHLAGGPNGEKGAMIAAGMSESEALVFCRDPLFEGKICVAASNAPSSVTLSGNMETINLARDKLTAQDRFARLLLVDTAYHSPHMSRSALAYTKALKKCNISPMVGTAQIHWISSVNGYKEDTERDIESAYWSDNMVRSVQFFDAVKVALKTFGPFDCAVEVGPHPALKGPVAQISKAMIGAPISHYGLLERAKDDSLAFSEFLGQIWCQYGHAAIDIKQYVRQSSDPSLVDTRLHDMPFYHWDHSQTHYRESRISRQFHFKTAAPHELLGARTRDDNEYELRWRNILRPEKLPWLEGHSFQGQALVPASAYCVMALDAAIQFLDGRAASIIEIQDLDIMSGISMEPDSFGTEVLFSLSVLDQTKEKAAHRVIMASFSLTSCTADGQSPMRKNASGRLSIILDKSTPDALPSRQASLAETLSASTEGFYNMMDETGLVYTGPFRALQSIQRRCNFASTTLRRRHPEDTTQLSVSPATLDSCLQSAFLTWSSPGDKSLWTSFLPSHISRIQFNVAHCSKRAVPDEQGTLRVDSHLTNVRGSGPDSKAMFTVDICIYNEKNEMEIEIEGLTVAAIAHTRPEDDHELYLHTVMDVDPTDEIVSPDLMDTERHLPELVETCERIKSFYTDSRIAFPNDTSEFIDHLVGNSPFRESLKLLQDMGHLLPALLPCILPGIIKEVREQLQLGRHIQRVTEQIAHKYPRMSVLTMMDSKTNVTDRVLQGLGNSFMYLTMATVGTDGEPRDNVRSEINGKVHYRHLQLDQDIVSQLDSAGRADLVVVASSIFQAADPNVVLKNIRTCMNDGGFLMFVHATESRMKKALDLVLRPSQTEQNQFHPEAEQKLMESCGFVDFVRNADQSFGQGFSISVRQAGAPFVNAIAKPLAWPATHAKENVLIIGTKGDRSSQLALSLQRRLSALYVAVELVASIENIHLETLPKYSSAIVLEDLEFPVVSSMTERKLSNLKELFRPDMTILWLTHNARFDNPEHAATLGFKRTVSAEVPNFNLQVLDLDDLESPDSLVVETHIRLTAAGPPANESLWVREPEIYMDNGRRLVNRVLPLKDLNERANALRRVVTKPVNTINQNTQLVSFKHEDGGVVRRVVASDWAPHPTAIAGTRSLRIFQSTLEAVKLGHGCFAHVCLGEDLLTGEKKVALSTMNASYVEVSSPLARRLPNTGLTGPQFIHSLTQYLVVLSALRQESGIKKDHVVFIDAEPLLVECAKIVAKSERVQFSDWTTDLFKRAGTLECIQIHSRSSERQLKALMPPNGATIYDFSLDRDLHRRVAKVLPKNCKYHRGSSLLSSYRSDQTTNSSLTPEASSTLSLGLELAAQTAGSSFQASAEIISIDDAVTDAPSRTPFTNIIDWTILRRSSSVVQPLVSQQLFSPHKTYILIGLTRDFGQSLSRLFLLHGARHIVLASRNPDMSPAWVTELRQSYGAQIGIERLNVTDLPSVHAFRSLLSTSMPPVGGIINGAMVLDDRVFSQMTVETWNRVLLPKTVGSKNLDVVFSDPKSEPLDFFIMTSSFAALGGHPGQSNYAAANMYMNGLAANRRKRGLTGSVLNIGVIYGLGLLQREKEELYVGLEREGYPPISERDIHHMFLEAIVAGRPSGEEPFDITTGLRRFRWGSENPLHWHLDPRFSHFTVDEGDSEAEAGTGAQRSLADELSSIKDVELMADRLVASFSGHLQVMLQLYEGSVNRHSSLSEIGIDSLVAVDIRNWIWKTLGRDVAVMKILGATSIHRYIR